MNYRKFGNTDLLVSEIGFGAWAIGGNAMVGNLPIGWGNTNDDESIGNIYRSGFVNASRTVATRCARSLRNREHVRIIVDVARGQRQSARSRPGAAVSLLHRTRAGGSKRVFHAVHDNQHYR